MNEAMFSFELKDKYPPEVVIDKKLKEISDVTRGYVSGKIEKYLGEISSYKKKVGLTAAFETLAIESGTIEVDIQEDLGEICSENHRFEVFLIVKGLEYYKYRMMFVDYGAIAYPVTVVMNDMLAYEYSEKRKTVFCVKSMQELEDMLDKILVSNGMVSLIQSLIGEALRQEKLTDDALSVEEK